MDVYAHAHGSANVTYSVYFIDSTRYDLLLSRLYTDQKMHDIVLCDWSEYKRTGKPGNEASIDRVYNSPTF